MRLLKRDMKPATFKARVTEKEPDGTTYETWELVGTTLNGNIQPAGGKVMAEQYGERLAYMKVMYVEWSEDAITLMNSFNDEEKGYGVWINSNADEPNYRVVAVRDWRHIVIELEKVK